MNEDLPLHRHTALMCWLAFIIGTVVLFLIPGILHNYNHFQPSDSNSEWSVTVSQPSKDYSLQPAAPGETEPLFHSIIQEASDHYQVDPELIRAIIMTESSNNPRAVSRKGARGLMQLMPATAKALGVENSFDPEHNIYGGVRYFRELLDRFDGDTEMALAAYNAGSRKVRQYRGIPPFKTTHYYIKRVLFYYNRYKAEMESA
ncbi:MAG: lytic transglycosylase domain-containing protein [Deltaproteobacteria bacterium]|nr:lytic transglycosylase domain-containing protein [Deltaproteobacteria bacterium]MBW2649032.1 lytic transglycosylase domain-containing protein [Deltaproteobacteria bacterium]